jgi:hypothetical protein
MTIASRYYPDLKSRPGSALMSLWFRIAALHGEAVSAYVGQKDILGVLMVVAMFPLRLTSVSLRCLFGRIASRRHFLKTNETPDNG